MQASFYLPGNYNPKNIFAANTAQIAATATTTSPLFRYARNNATAVPINADVKSPVE